jgi:hypothetical protein
MRCLCGISAIIAFVLTGATARAEGLTPLFRAFDGEYRALDDQQSALEAELQTLPVAPANQQSERLGYQFWRSVWDPEQESVWVEVDLGKEQPLDAIVLVPVDAPYREFPGPGYGFPARFRVEIRGETDAPAHVIADHTASVDLGRFPITSFVAVCLGKNPVAIPSFGALFGYSY